MTHEQSRDPADDIGSVPEITLDPNTDGAIEHMGATALHDEQLDPIAEQSVTESGLPKRVRNAGLNPGTAPKAGEGLESDVPDITR